VGSVNFMYLSATLYNLLQLTDCVLWLWIFVSN
jgi:hypothetical protein